MPDEKLRPIELMASTREKGTGLLILFCFQNRILICIIESC
jgi:hypothetical protein